MHTHLSGHFSSYSSKVTLAVLRTMRVFWMCLFACSLAKPPGSPDPRPVSSLSHETMTACPGENVTLTCVGLMKGPIEAVEWYEKGHYKSFVFSWRGDDKPDVENQLEAFKGRVNLMDLEMKNNDVSVTIKNVTVNDTGIYECHIYDGPKDHPNPYTPFGTNHTKIITLTVSDTAGDHTAGGEEEGGDLRNKDEGNTTGQYVNGTEVDISKKDEGNRGRIGLIVSLVFFTIPIILLSRYTNYKRPTNHLPDEEVSKSLCNATNSTEG